MPKLTYRFEKLEKTINVGDNFIYPIYGQKVNEFNEWLRVCKTDNRYGEIVIELERL